MDRTEAERKAQLSLILGIVGLVVAQLVLGVVAIWFANQARALAAAAGQPEPKDARTGRILGIISVVLGLLGIVAFFLVLLLARNMGHDPWFG